MPRQQSSTTTSRDRRGNVTSRTTKGEKADDYVDPEESRIGRGLSALAAATENKAEDQADAIEAEAKPTPTPTATPTPTPTPTATPSPTPPPNESPLARASRLARERREKNR